ncbi:transcriptional regulator [Salmonella enterica subsp. enterica]|nr:transcriptional regulator [Salmonella enterica subsp. enterica]
MFRGIIIADVIIVRGYDAQRCPACFPDEPNGFFDPENVSEVFTARYLAQRFNMQRNTASHYLNQLVAQGVLCKINTRPVYFLHKQAFSQQFFTLSRNEYASVAELLAHGEQESAPDDHFSLLIGHNERPEAPD